MLKYISRATKPRQTHCSPFFHVVLALFLFSFVLTACAGNTQSSDTITLQLLQWTNQPAVDAVKIINEAFQKKHPNIKVSVTHVPTASDEYLQLQNSRLAANNVDIMALQAFVGSPQPWSTGAQKPSWQQWIEGGNLLDLTGQPFLKNYDAQALADASTFDGKVYSVTTGRYAMNGVFYNKKMFSDNQLKVPTTFDELMNVCEVLQSKGITPFVMGGKDTWPLYVATFGAQSSLMKDQAKTVEGLWTGDVKFTDPENVEILRRMQKIMQYTQEGFMGLDYGTATSYFPNEQVAMYPMGTWDAPTFKQANPALEFGYFPLPVSDNAADNTKLAGKYDLAWVVNAKTSPEKRDAALKWLEFFSEPENYATYVNRVGILPVQDNIDLQDAFIKELAPLASGENFILAWDQLIIGKQNAGQYANGPAGTNMGFQIEYLAPAGQIQTPEELAKLTQEDWDAAS